MSLYGCCKALAHNGNMLHPWTPRCEDWVPRATDKLLPPHQDPESRHGSIATVQFTGDAEQKDWLYRRIAYLERELAGAEDRYTQLNGIYQKLADQWNAYQATARPDNRNMHRAEAAGEMGRKLAEVLIGLAYDKDVRDLLREVLERLSDEGPDAARQEYTVRSTGKALPEPR